MAEKWNGNSLARKYGDFVDPCVKVRIGGKEVICGEGQYIEEVRVFSSVGRDADMAVITYWVGEDGKKKINSLEGFLQVGQKTEIWAGYGNCVTRIFLGYLHEITAAGREGGDVAYTLICLDVKGLMQKNNCFARAAGKSLGQQLTEILNTAVYAPYIEKKSIDKLPSCFAEEPLIFGETHYDWICALAQSADFEFYCGRGELCFRKAQKDDSVLVKLNGQYGLLKVRVTVTLQEQTGSVRIYGYNRKDQKIMASHSRKTVPGPFADRINQTLLSCRKVLWDMELEDGEQASERAKAFMDRSLRKCSRMEAVNIGIPELAPGSCVLVESADMTSLSGKFYVEEAEHVIDRRGYRTILRGSRVSGGGQP